MKLPEDKKERVKILALVGVGSILVVYGLYVGVINPMVKGKKERADTIESLQEKLRKAGGAIARMAVNQNSNSNILAELDDVANRRALVLRDRLGNFLLGASEIIENHARKAGVQIELIKENGMSQIPQSTARTTPGTFNAYTISVRALCGTHELLRLLQEIETNNPYLCVSSVTINAQPGKPEKHAVTFEVQWPSWADAKMPATLNERLRLTREDTATNPPAAAPGGEKGPS